MTKKVRIENADISNHKLAVVVEDLVGDTWVEQYRHRIDSPTQLSEVYVHRTRRAVIVEVTE